MDTLSYETLESPRSPRIFNLWSYRSTSLKFSVRKPRTSCLGQWRKPSTRRMRWTAINASLHVNLQLCEWESLQGQLCSSAGKVWEESLWKRHIHEGRETVILPEDMRPLSSHRRRFSSEVWHNGFDHLTADQTRFFIFKMGHDKFQIGATRECTKMQFRSSAWRKSYGWNW